MEAFVGRDNIANLVIVEQNNVLLGAGGPLVSYHVVIAAILRPETLLYILWLHAEASGLNDVIAGSSAHLTRVDQMAAVLVVVIIDLIIIKLVFDGRRGA